MRGSPVGGCRVLEEVGEPTAAAAWYSEEFKRDAVTLVLAGDRSIVDVANSLGIVEQARELGSPGPGGPG